MRLMDVIDGIGVMSLGFSWLYNRRRATVSVGWFIFVGSVITLAVFAHGLQTLTGIAR